MHRDLDSAPSARAAASWSWRRPDGASERNLEALDEEKRALSDVIADAPLPIQDYVSTLTVRATAGLEGVQALPGSHHAEEG
jgi:hypothetical protein